MKNVLIIAGSLALIGGGIYFYSKKKKEEQKVNKLQALTEPTPIPTTPTTTVNSELAPLPVVYGQVEINLQKAQDIVRKSLKGKKWSDVLNSTLKTINAKVGKLGYTYKEGVLTKI